jgi:hypothetical protein
MLVARAFETAGTALPFWQYDLSPIVKGAAVPVEPGQLSCENGTLEDCPGVCGLKKPGERSARNFSPVRLNDDRMPFVLTDLGWVAAMPRI